MICRLIALWVLALGLVGQAMAQNYPAKPIRIVVPFAPGGSSDVMARSLGKYLGEQMATQFITENRPGAGGGLAMEAVAKSPPDGYTVLFGTIGTNGVAPALFRNLPIDPGRDLAPVSMLHLTPSVLIVNSLLPIQSLDDLIRYAKANPGKLTYASAGNGSISHLAGELLKSTADINLIHVPYKGGGAAMPDLLAGNVSMMIETMTNAMAATKGGKLRAIASTAGKRWSTAPDLPTFAEAGLAGYQVDSWTGLFVAAGTSRLIIDRLNTEIVNAARDPSYRQAMAAIGVEAVSSSPEAFGTFVRAEVAKWGKTIQATGTKID